LPLNATINDAEISNEISNEKEILLNVALKNETVKEIIGKNFILCRE